MKDPMWDWIVKVIQTLGFPVFLIVFYLLYIYPNQTKENEKWLQTMTLLQDSLDPRKRPLDQAQARTILEFYSKTFTSTLSGILDVYAPVDLQRAQTFASVVPAGYTYDACGAVGDGSTGAVPPPNGTQTPSAATGAPRALDFVLTIGSRRFSFLYSPVASTDAVSRAATKKKMLSTFLTNPLVEVFIERVNLDNAIDKTELDLRDLTDKLDRFRFGSTDMAILVNFMLDQLIPNLKRDLADVEHTALKQQVAIAAAAFARADPDLCKDTDIDVADFGNAPSGPQRAEVLLRFEHKFSILIDTIVQKMDIYQPDVPSTLANLRAAMNHQENGSSPQESLSQQHLPPSHITSQILEK
jgi:hypothetical protein